MTRMLAIEWADNNIRVNAIAPTTVMTESRQQLLSDPKARGGALSRIPIGPLRHAGGDRRRGGLSREPRRGLRSPATRCRSTAG